MIQVLTTAGLHGVLPAVIELVSHTYTPKCRVRRLETVQCDGARLAMVLEGFAEGSLRCSHISPAAEMRFDGAAPLVDSAVQMYPLAPDLDIGFVLTPVSPCRFLEWPPVPGEFDGVANEPPQNRAGADSGTQLSHYLRQISLAELNAQVPADAQDNAVIGVPALGEQWVASLVATARHIRHGDISSCSRAAAPNAALPLYQTNA